MSLIGGRCIAALAAMLFVFSLCIAEDNKEEAIYSFTYKDFESDYSVFFENDSVYIPLEDILTFLNIYYVIDDNHSLKGYVNNADSSFVIDFTAKAYKDITGTEGGIDNSHWFAGDLQIYIRSDVFCKIFNCNIRIYSRKLMLRLTCNYQMPVVRANRVFIRNENFERNQEDEDIGPLISDKVFRVLNGGTLDYSLGASKSVVSESYSFNSNLGMQVLGGEFQYQASGITQKGQLNLQENLRWVYQFSHDIIQNISLGNVYQFSQRGNNSKGYRKPLVKILGAQITNESTKIPNVFLNYIIEDYTEPSWNIELYIDNQLYDVQKSDLNGYYRFEIPVSYGVTNISVKYYGLRGEYVSTDKVLNIPSELLMPGDIIYTLSGGYDEYSDKNLIDGFVSVGLTDWLTTTVSGTKAESSGDYLVVSQSAINLFRNFLLNLTANNQGIYEASFRINTNTIGNYDIIYTNYDKSFTKYNSNKLGLLQLYTTYNNVLGLPVSFSIMGSRNIFENYNSNSINSMANFNLLGISFMMRYGMSFNDISFKVGEVHNSFSISSSYFINRMPSFISFLNGIRINATADINPKALNVNSVSGSIQQDLFKSILFNLNIDYYPPSRSTNLRLSLNFNLPQFRTTTNIDRNNQGAMSYSGTMNGSVEFDSYNLRFNFLNSLGSSGMYGKSSASIKFYRDLNYNKKFDESDELIPDIDFYLTTGLTNKINAGGYKVLSNLMPGETYNVKVKEETIPDPSMIPEYLEFSFVAEPYTYKSIEIPVQTGGIIEGLVTLESATGKKGLGGAKIHIEDIKSDYSKSVNVFSDGSFFYSGLPVGKYRAYIDKAQLKILNCKSFPDVREIEIKPSAEGDYIGDINFELLKAGTLPTDERLIADIDKNRTGYNPEALFSDLSRNTSVPEENFGSISSQLMPLLLDYPDAFSTAIDPRIDAKLNQLAEYMANNPNVSVSVTSIVLKAQYSRHIKEISAKRTAIVVNFLESKGIARDRFTERYTTINNFSNYSLPPATMNAGIIEIDIIY